MTDKALSKLIGKFVKHHRLQQNKTQNVIATEAGISRSTLSLLERGEKVNLSTLIQVLRILDLLDLMEVFEVNETISPIAYAKLKKKQRKKASPQQKNIDKSKTEDIGW